MTERKIDNIIENKMTIEEIKGMYLNNELKFNEWLLLMSLNENGRFLQKYMTGKGEYKLYLDSNVDPELYFTNIKEMLSAFYTLYNKYPNYHFDQILKEGLDILSNDTYQIYQFIKIFFQQMENEENKQSPFKVIDKNMLENCKRNFNRVKENLKKARYYDAKDRENGYIDVISDMNQIFKQKLNYDIFLEDDNSNKKHM